MPTVPGPILVRFFTVGTMVASTELPPNNNPPKSAPATEPTPPTTANSTIGRLCVNSYCCGLTLSPASAPAQAAMPAEIAKAANFVRVRLIPNVAAAAGESFNATRRRPRRLRRTATTIKPRIAKQTEARISRARGVSMVTKGIRNTGTVMLPVWKVWRWLKTILLTITANAAVARAR